MKKKYVLYRINVQFSRMKKTTVGSGIDVLLASASAFELSS